MAPLVTFANLQDGLNPLSLFDQMFAQAGSLGGSAIFADFYGVVTGDVASNEATNNTAFAAIKTALGSGGKTVIFPAGIIRFSSAWDLSSLTNVTFIGQGGIDLNYSGTTGTVLKFTGTGSGNAINMQEHRGVWWNNVQLVYTSNSFTGTLFNMATLFQTGCGSGFRNVMCYQVTNTGHNAGQCFYLKNNVDVTWINCYVARATFGWLGVFDTDGSSVETNMVKLYNCTAIALKTAAIVNPKVGWSLYGCNFEPSDTNAPAGVLSTNLQSVTNFQMYGCVFADCTANGTWVNFASDVNGFGMYGGAMLSLGGTVTGIMFNGTQAFMPTIQGVYFSGTTTGINFNVPTSAACVSGNGFFSGVVTPISGKANLSGSFIFGNTPNTSGGGQLTFPATQVPSADANTLDDYEEGTWVPTLTFSTPGDLNVVYSTRVGTYTKVGRAVTLSFQVRTSTFTKTTSSGTCQITGLPFAAVGSADYGAVFWSGVTKAAYTNIVAHTNGNSIIQFFASGSGSAGDNLNAADMPSAGSVILEGTVTYNV